MKQFARFGIGPVLAVCIVLCNLFPAKVAGQAAESRKPGLHFTSFLRTELFFGMEKPGGGRVTEVEWEKFVSDIVTPRFPDGLTVDDALGQYLDGKTLVREKSKQLILIYPRKYKTSSSRKIEEIRAAYIKTFDQKSVLRVDLPHAVLVSF